MRKKAFVSAVIGLVVAGLAIWGFVEGRKELAHEAQREKPLQVPSRVLAQSDGVAVVFDAATRKRADIAVAAVQMANRSGEVDALATVLPPQELIDLRSAYVAARTQAESRQAAVQASRGEYERTRALHGDEFNVSTKALEAAQAQWQSDAAAAQGASEAREAVVRSACQKWGAALTAAVAGDAASFRRLADGRDVLLRIAAPAGAALPEPPATARVPTSHGGLRTATLVSPSPQADPRIQGPTFFYSAPSDGLLPGTTVTAHLPIGAARSGAIVPADAVVWWQGKAWYYVQGAPDHFMRRELTDAQAVNEGWFVPGLSSLHVVVRGAQTLLSEELRGQTQTGEED